MSRMPSEAVLEWAAAAVGSGAKIASVEAMHENVGPWWLRVDVDGVVQEAVLRVAWRIPARELITVAAALRFAADHEVAAPRLIAADLEGGIDGTAALIETALPGSSALPPTVSVERLREAGAAIARLHAIRLDPRPDLPLRTRPTAPDDRARDRRWATLYQASEDAAKQVVIDAFRELTGTSNDRAREAMNVPRLTPLLQLADERIRELDRPSGETVFVHGDVWTGNMRWDGDTCLALIDWRCAGAGPPGVDLGELRMQMAHQYGLDAADHVLDGWNQQSGRQATNVAYWDAVAALNTPADMAGWPGFDDHGNPADQTVIVQRRDAFLRAALDQL